MHLSTGRALLTSTVKLALSNLNMVNMSIVPSIATKVITKAFDTWLHLYTKNHCERQVNSALVDVSDFARRKREKKRAKTVNKRPRTLPNGPKTGLGGSRVPGPPRAQGTHPQWPHMGSARFSPLTHHNGCLGLTAQKTSISEVKTLITCLF